MDEQEARSPSPAPVRRPTIIDVAARAGVSKSLVSLAMRGDPRVGEASRRRIEQAAEELGYRTNWAARSLSTLRSGTVGVLVADLHNPWFVEIVDPLRSVLHAAGLHTLLTSAVMPGPRAGEEARLDVGAIEALRSLKVEGLVVVGSLPDHSGLVDAVGDVPVVVAGAGRQGLVRADVVRSDDAAGAGLVVDHLVAHGHERIAHLGGAGGEVADERAAGYRAAMARHGLADRCRIEACDFTEEAGRAGVLRLLDGGRRPTAITVVNDLAAVGAMAGALEAGVPVPTELAVTGYNDSFFAAIPQVSLTTVNPDNGTIGASAAHHLLRRIGRPDAEPETELIPPRLVTRASSSQPPSRASRRAATARRTDREDADA
jgi:DNA-binding LacI/PurR family transcriptional regulator